MNPAELHLTSLVYLSNSSGPPLSTRQKAEVARQAGVGDVILYTEADFEAEVMRITNGRGADVVYDSVARAAFDKNLKSVRMRGMLALFDQTSGPSGPVGPSRLWEKGVFLIRLALAYYTTTRDELLA